MNRWLFKTEPEEYSYDMLTAEGCGTWDGVRNRTAQRHLASTHPGDQVLIYHTGKNRAVVGLASVASVPYPERGEEHKGYVAVDIVPAGRLNRPVLLAEIKEDPVFSGWELVRLPRLSVMPVSEQCWERILQMAAQHGNRP